MNAFPMRCFLDTTEKSVVAEKLERHLTDSMFMERKIVLIQHLFFMSADKEKQAQCTA